MKKKTMLKKSMAMVAALSVVAGSTGVAYAAELPSLSGAHSFVGKLPNHTDKVISDLKVSTPEDTSSEDTTSEDSSSDSTPSAPVGPLKPLDREPFTPVGEVVNKPEDQNPAPDNQQDEDKESSGEEESPVTALQKFAKKHGFELKSPSDMELNPDMLRPALPRDLYFAEKMKDRGFKTPDEFLTLSVAEEEEEEEKFDYWFGGGGSGKLEFVSEDDDMLMPMAVTDNGDYGALGTLGEKATKDATSMKTKDNRYKVDVRVPGMDGAYNDYIIMLDASTSVYGKWSHTLEIIRAFGEQVLADTEETAGNTLTIMSFGISPTLAAVYDSKEDLAGLEDVDPADFREGVSATNIEGALNFVSDYVGRNGNSYVTVITDGNTNMSDEALPFQNALDPEDKTYRAGTREDMVNMLIECMAQAIIDRGQEADPVAESFGITTEVIADTSEEGMLKLNRILNAETEGTLYRTGETGTYKTWELWLDSLFNKVYEEAGLTYDDETGCAVSELQQAFIDYDKKYYDSTGDRGTLVTTEMSLYAHFRYTQTKSYADSNKTGNRASEAMNELLDDANVYALSFNGNANNWLNPAAGKIDTDADHNYEFIHIGSYEGIAKQVEAIAEATDTTPYNDVSISDYMSKWVNFVPDSIRVFDDRIGAEIWNQTEGWLIEEDERPTDAEVPVVVTEVPADEYEGGGDDVIGNTDGTIYRLDWKVKDGALLTSDRYRMQYEVTVDTSEDGFKFNTDYPANGNTDVHYTDEDGVEQDEPVDVPDVEVPKKSNGGGGGKNPTPRVEIDEEDVPLAEPDVPAEVTPEEPAEDPTEDITDGDVPMAAPEVEEEGMVAGAEDEVVATTGDSNHMTAAAGGMLVALAGIFGLKRRKENN